MTKCRFMHKTVTDRNQAIQYQHRIVLIMTFFKPVLTGPFQSMKVFCWERHFVLVPVPLYGENRKRHTREIYTKNLRAQLCEIARNYAYIFGINFPGRKESRSYMKYFSCCFHRFVYRKI